AQRARDLQGEGWDVLSRNTESNERGSWGVRLRVGLRLPQLPKRFIRAEPDLRKGRGPGLLSRAERFRRRKSHHTNLEFRCRRGYLADGEELGIYAVLWICALRIRICAADDVRSAAAGTIDVPHHRHSAAGHGQGIYADAQISDVPER